MQLYDGVAVNYSDILPGDIINWDIVMVFLRIQHFMLVMVK